MKFKFVQEIVKMFRCRKHEEPQTLPPHAVEIPALHVIGVTESVIPASSRVQVTQVQPDVVAEVYVVPTQPVPKTGTEAYEPPVVGQIQTPAVVLEPKADVEVAVPPPCKALDMDALFEKLPIDCNCRVLGTVTQPTGRPCGKIECRTCAGFKYDEIITTTTRAAADLGLRYRVAVSLPSDVCEGEYYEWFNRVLVCLRRDAEYAADHQFAYVCMRGIDAHGKPNLNLLTNVDFRLGVDSAVTKDDYRARRLGTTYRPLMHWKLVEFHELGYSEVGAEVKRMTRNLVEHLVSGYNYRWKILCSYQYWDYQSAGATGRLLRAVEQQMKKRGEVALSSDSVACGNARDGGGSVVTAYSSRTKAHTAWVANGRSRWL